MESGEAGRLWASKIENFNECFDEMALSAGINLREPGLSAPQVKVFCKHKAGNKVAEVLRGIKEYSGKKEECSLIDDVYEFVGKVPFFPLIEVSKSACKQLGYDTTCDTNFYIDDHVDRTALAKILAIIQEPFCIPIIQEEEDFIVDLQLYQAAIALGLPEESVQYVCYSLVEILTSRLITIEELEAILYSPDGLRDANLYGLAARNVAYHRHTGNLPNLLEYMEIIDRCENMEFMLNMADFDFMQRSS